MSKDFIMTFSNGFLNFIIFIVFSLHKEVLLIAQPFYRMIILMSALTIVSVKLPCQATESRLEGSNCYF